MASYCRNCFNTFALRFYLEEKASGNEDNFCNIMGKCATYVLLMNENKMFQQEEDTIHIIYENNKICKEESNMFFTLLENISDRGLIDLAQKFSSAIHEHRQQLPIKHYG